MNINVSTTATVVLTHPGATKYNNFFESWKMDCGEKLTIPLNLLIMIFGGREVWNSIEGPFEDGIITIGEQE